MVTSAVEQKCSVSQFRGLRNTHMKIGLTNFPSRVARPNDCQTCFHDKRLKTPSKPHSSQSYHAAEQFVSREPIIFPPSSHATNVQIPTLECVTYIHDKLEQQITVICENSTSGIVKTERMRGRLLLLYSPQRFRCTSLMEAFRKTYEKILC